MEHSPNPPPSPLEALPLPCAGLWRRSMSALYETIVLFGVVIFFGYGFSAITQFKGAPGLLRLAFQVWLVVIIGAYFVWFWSQGRRTLPMKTVALRLLSTTGSAPTRRQAAVRYLVALSLLIAPIGLAASFGPGYLLLLIALPLTALLDRERRTLYDRASGTRLVVDARPQP